MLNVFTEYAEEISLFSLIVTIVSVIVAFKQFRFKQLKFLFKTNLLIKDFGSQFSGLSVAYNGNSIKALSTTKILFFAHGNETLHRQDISAASPLKIDFSDNEEILEANILQANPANAIELELAKDKRSCKMIFDYLDRGEFFILQIVHTSLEFSSQNIKGNLKGSRALSVIDKDLSTYKDLVGLSFGLTLFASLGAIMVRSAIQAYSSTHEIFWKPLMGGIVAFFVLVLSIILGIYVIYHFYQMPPKQARKAIGQF